MASEDDEALARCTAFWGACSRLLAIYPDRPATMSGDAEAKQLERRLKALSQELLPLLATNDHWLTDASVGKGNWATIPWVAIFDSRESRSAQQGVYPVIHLSPEAPVGVRIGLGVSATAFRSQEDEKAAEVWDGLTERERGALVGAGFTDVVHGGGKRIEIGAGNLARKYAKGMVFERFAALDELKSSPTDLTRSLQALVATYKAWVDRTSGQHESLHAFGFLDLMQSYADERVVYMSPKRDARYFVSGVSDRGCTIERLDSNKPASLWETSYRNKLELLRASGGRLERGELDSTVAVHMAYLQSNEMALSADRKTAVLLDDSARATELFIELIHKMQTVTLYKPVILALVIEGIRDGELTHNHIEFDWLLPRFVTRLKEHGHDDTGEQQLAEGFGRLAIDLFWLHAYRDPLELVPLDRPTPKLIRSRISHARLQEPYWRAMQNWDNQQKLLDALAERWWPNVTPPPANSDLSEAIERLIEAIAAKGFVFHPWQIATYVNALRTKPFVILAGVSGTGKSQLPSLVSKLTGGNCERVSVRPDWTDSSEVLGYIDLNDRFRPGRVLEQAKIASNERDQYHVCLIDEMNLARVEHYFAEVLSAIEDRESAAFGGFQSTALISQKLPDEFAEWQEQVLPANLGLVGTVNMDESSHGFSRKVLDRAFTIELSEVDLTLESTSPTPPPTSPPAIWPIQNWLCKATRLSEVDLNQPSIRMIAERATSLLQEINRSLVHCQLQVGYRTRDEVILFLINAEEIKDAFRTRSGESVDPLDLAVMMKVLPRLVGGSNSIRQTMTGLIGVAVSGQPFVSEDKVVAVVDEWLEAGRPDWIENNKLPRSAARLCLMWKRLDDGFTSYWL